MRFAKDMQICMFYARCACDSYAKCFGTASPTARLVFFRQHANFLSTAMNHAVRAMANVRWKFHKWDFPAAHKNCTPILENTLIQISTLALAVFSIPF